MKVKKILQRAQEYSHLGRKEKASCAPKCKRESEMYQEKNCHKMGKWK